MYHRGGDMYHRGGDMYHRGCDTNRVMLCAWTMNLCIQHVIGRSVLMCICTMAQTYPCHKYEILLYTSLILTLKSAPNMSSVD